MYPEIVCCLFSFHLFCCHFVFQQNTGRVSSNLFSAYSVSKFGVEAFSDALRREMYSWGVKVSIVEPGAFKTNINVSSKFKRDFKEHWENLNEQKKEEYGEDFLEAGTLSRYTIALTHFSPIKHANSVLAQFRFTM